MTDAPTPNTGEAVDFLMCFAGNDPIMLTAIIPDGGGLESLTVRPETEGAKTRDWINQRQGKANIYFTVNPTIKPMSGQGIKAKKTDIRGMKALHVDIDPRVGEDPAQELERGIRVLEGFNPPPTYIVKSGNGVQGFWVLDEEQQTNGSEELAAGLEAYNQQIALVLHADACHNIDRIMRLPGTINVPDAKKRKKGPRSRTGVASFQRSGPSVQHQAVHRRAANSAEIHRSGNRRCGQDFRQSAARRPEQAAREDQCQVQGNHRSGR